MQVILGFYLVLVVWFWGGEALADRANFIFSIWDFGLEEKQVVGFIHRDNLKSKIPNPKLIDRVAEFPNWLGKPNVEKVVGTEDLVYPDWMAGTWLVTSTLVDLVAPLAPDIVTPGFESNRQYLNQPIRFEVRFAAVGKSDFIFPVINPKSKIQNLKSPSSVVANRAFNGLNIARAVLGEDAIASVKIDPNNPNRQITTLRPDRQLVSIVTGRKSEMPSRDRFISTEVCQQLFRGNPQIYLNEVETTTAYQFLGSEIAIMPVENLNSKAANLNSKAGDTPTPQEFMERSIIADQITAVYLSPQDPNYFKTGEKPVALYRYRLEFEAVNR